MYMQDNAEAYNQQAVHMVGLESSNTEADPATEPDEQSIQSIEASVKSAVEKLGAIERVVVHSNGQQAFVFVSGTEQEKAQSRAAIIEALHGQWVWYSFHVKNRHHREHRLLHSHRGRQAVQPGG